jgi:hypothetical protein
MEETLLRGQSCLSCPENWPSFTMPDLHYRAHKSLPLDAILSHMESVNILKSYFLKQLVKLYSIFCLVFSSDHSSPDFLTCSFKTSRPSNSHFFSGPCNFFKYWHPSNIGRMVQIMIFLGLLLSMFPLFSPVLCSKTLWVYLKVIN